MMLKTLTAGLVAFVIGGAGGFLFFWLHLPLPWTLGSLSACAIVAILRNGFVIPPVTRSLARPVVGVIAGSAFTPTLAASGLQSLDVILAVVAFSLLTTGLGYIFFRKIGHFDPTTAFFASAPGGLAEMTLLGGTYGGQMSRIVLVQMARIIIVVFTIPILLQIVLGQRIGAVSPLAPALSPLSGEDAGILFLCALLGFGISLAVRFPAGAMLFPLLLSAAMHVTGVTQAVLPPWVLAIMQVVIGGIAGARFGDIRWHEARSTLVLAMIWAVAMVLLAAGVAEASVWILDRPFSALLLALAPGGMVEMTVITIALGIDVAFVVTCQVFRILLVLTLMPVAYRLTIGTNKPPG